MTDQQHDTDQVKDAHENAQGAQELKSSDVGQCGFARRKNKNTHNNIVHTMKISYTTRWLFGFKKGTKQTI